jgi:hypothetical protein
LEVGGNPGGLGNLAGARDALRVEISSAHLFGAEASHKQGKSTRSAGKVEDIPTGNQVRVKILGESRFEGVLPPFDVFLR